MLYIHRVKRDLYLVRVVSAVRQLYFNLCLLNINMIFVVILLSICLVSCHETQQTNDKLKFAQIVS